MSPWRLLYPANAINHEAETNEKRKDWEAKLVHTSGFINYMDPVVQDIVMSKELVIVQRNVINQQVLDAMTYFRCLGRVCCIDLDDAYWGLDTQWDNPARAFWIMNGAKLDPPPLVMLERGLQQSDGLVAPNRLLLEEQKHNCRGYYVPNFAPAAFWKDEVDIEAMRKERGIDKDRIIIGWGGSVSHFNSWMGSGIREAATRISQRYPEVLWMICGNDARVYDQLPVSAHDKFKQPGVVALDWPKVVRMFDIGVAPLFGGYDQHRSWIKGLEYMLAGIPWIASTGEPYNDLSQWGTLIQNSPIAWEDALDKLIQNVFAEKVITKARIPMARKLLLMEENLDVLEAVYAQIIREADARRGQLPGIYHVTKKAVTA